MVLAALVLAGCHRPSAQEAAAYASQIEFQNVRLSASENFAHQTVHYLSIDVYNRGQRSVEQLEVVLTFRNTLGQVALTQRATAVSPRTRPLAPGQKRDFRAGFDPPPDWNVRQPEISISNLVIE